MGVYDEAEYPFLRDEHRFLTHVLAQGVPGGGAAFRFTLPLTGTPPPVVAEVETANTPQPVTNEC